MKRISQQNALPPLGSSAAYVLPLILVLAGCMATNGAGVGQRFRDCAECPEMVVVPAGSFLMGSPDAEEGRDEDEGPLHRVTFAAPFAVGIYEVTFDEWDACVADGGCGGHRPYDEGWGRGRRPVMNVNWEDAQLYVDWLSDRSGWRYRLLSEAEWEYAARAGTTGPFHTGSTISTDQANYDGDLIYGNGVWGEYRKRTMPVGSFPANGFGLHDMHGNVWEWVQDCWAADYQGVPNDGAASGSGDCTMRVVRGGSWVSSPVSLRSANRMGYDDWGAFTGFRVVRTQTPYQEEADIGGVEAGQPKEDGTFRDCPECPEMVVIPAGSFMKGGRQVHRVSVPSFAAGVYEVTVSEFVHFVEGTGHSPVTHSPVSYGEEHCLEYRLGWLAPDFRQRGSHPVVCVSWDDARAYVDWLSHRTGERYRLLSESEWEYAARAGTTGPFHTGSKISTDQANYDGRSAGEYRKRTVPVGSFPSNGFGLHDVHGNVWEWVQDCWNGNYQEAPSDGGAWESGDCSYRVLRGGSWNNSPRYLHSANRIGINTGFRDSLCGFRVARTL